MAIWKSNSQKLERKHCMRASPFPAKPFLSANLLRTSFRDAKPSPSGTSPPLSARNF
jgi:hypothetical protein